jgi:hypothetical protein
MQEVSNLNHPGAAMPVIQIIAGRAVRYFTNNNTETEFDDGEYYDVRENVARGMVKRGWAKIVTVAPGEHPGEPHPEPGKEPAPVKEPPQPHPEKPADDDDDDDDDDDGKHERAASLRTKGRRKHHHDR